MAIEHRYYGQSNPVPDFTTENMRFLNTRQSLADMATIIRMSKTLPGVGPLPTNIKWITVGGSYSGNLAAWMRLKYPDLVFAAYSSSAPVKAELDFFEYDLAIGDGLPAACTLSLVRVTEYIDNQLAKKDSAIGADLRRQFGLEVVTDDRDFVGAMIDAPSYIVQYGEINGNWTRRFCDALTHGFTDATPLADVARSLGAFQQAWMKERDIKPSDYNGVPDKTDLADNKSGGRQWTWQTCIEYGYWQTAPKAPLRATRSRLIDLAYYEQGCKQAFGPSVPMHAAVERINADYLAQSINIPRVVYANGKVDPWRRLSVSAAPDAPEPTRPVDALEPQLVILDGHHCWDLYSLWDKSSESMKDVEATIDRTIVQWLSEAP